MDTIDSVKIIARQLVEAVHPDDEGVEGVYIVSLRQPVEAKLAPDAALDVFHETMAVEELDNFEFIVTSMDNKVLETDVNYEGYSFKSGGSVSLTDEQVSDLMEDIDAELMGDIDSGRAVSP